MSHPGSSTHLKKGWLRKHGGMVQKWQRRWFVLNGDCLFYFAKDDDLRPLGSIFLPGNKVVRHEFNADDPDKFLFEVVSGKEPSKSSNQESFLLCAASDEERQDWIKAIKKVMYSSLGGAIFGESLAETMKFERGRSNRKVPYIVEACIDFLRQYGTEIEGIFRLPGRMVLVRELKDKFDEGEQVVLDLNEMDVHSVASLLKQYLRELPECLIPYKSYQEYMNIAMRFQDTSSSENKMEQVDILKSAMSGLPQDNYNVLKILCKFLHEVALKTHINKMTALNLATVFGPNIIRHPNMEDNPEIFMLTTADLSQQLAYMLINHSDQIFTIDFETDGKSAPVAVDDLLNIGDDVDGDSALQPVPFTQPPEPKTFEELSEIRFDQRGDRRARSFGMNEFLSDLKISIPDADTETSSQQSFSDESPREVTGNQSQMQLTEDGKPIPPIRSKFRRGQSRKQRHVNDTEAASPITPTSEKGIENKLNQVQVDEKDAEIVKLQERVKHLEDLYDALKFKYDNLYQKKTRCDERIRDLSADNSKIQKRYEEHIKNIEAKHKAQMQDLCSKLDQESTSRAECVEKIVELKSKIHTYELQHGSIGNSVSDIYKVT